MRILLSTFDDGRSVDYTASAGGFAVGVHTDHDDAVAGLIALLELNGIGVQDVEIEATEPLYLAHSVMPRLCEEEGCAKLLDHAGPHENRR